MCDSILLTLRSYPWRHQCLCLLPLCLTLCAIALFIGTGNESTLYFKECGQRHPGLTRALKIVSDWTSMALYALYVLLLWRALKNDDPRLVRFVLTFIAVQIFISAILVQLAKVAVGKPRPLDALAGVEYSPFNVKGKFHSFPSGHTSEITGAAFPLANWFRCPLFSLFLGLVSALVGFSRIYLCKHQSSDIVGGIVAGILAGLLIHHLGSREQV